MPSLLSPTFYIGYIHIRSVEGASSVNLGNNWLTDFESYKKHTQGFGEIDGDHNRFTDARATVSDSELIDMLNLSDDANLPDWLKELIVKSSHQAVNDNK